MIHFPDAPHLERPVRSTLSLLLNDIAKLAALVAIAWVVVTLVQP